MFGSIAIEPTNVCNLKCDICYARTAKRDQGLMSFELYKKIIDEVITLKIGCIGLNYGGEPTIHPLFVDMIKYTAQKGQYVQFSTNGTLLTENMIDIIASGYVKKVNFSLHTELDIVESNIIKIIDKRLSKRPQITATINIGEFDDKTIDLLKDRFGHLVDIIGIQPNITDMKWSKVPIHSKVNLRRYCRQSQRYIAVLYDGRITICCHDIGGEMAFGNISSNSLVDTWNSEYYVNLRKSILTNKFPKNSLCERCNVKGNIIYQ